MTRQKKDKIIVVLGPTATGKSELAIKLARKFNGEIVSADSRQIYKGMNIGSGKVTKRERNIVPHHLLDVVKPQTEFTLARYQKLAYRCIDDIISRQRLPFLVGGTGLYIRAICDNWNIPAVRPNKKLRKKLEQLSLSQLRAKYKKIDPLGYEHIDRSNPRRLSRAIEVVTATRHSFWEQRQKGEPRYDCLKIGLTCPKQELAKRIEGRVIRRLRRGWIKEVERLHADGVSYRRLYDFGLGYRRIAQYLKENKISKSELTQLITQDEFAYAKRQMTWFKKDRCITWLKNYAGAEELINLEYKTASRN